MIFLLHKKRVEEKIRGTARMRRRGFTLIEVLVAVGLFSVVTTIATGSILSVIATSAQSQVVQRSLDNMNFALESMTRRLRTGTTYHCDVTVLPLTVARDCVGGSSSLAFERARGNKSSASDQWVFRLAQGRIERSVDGGASFLPITSAEIDITSLMFFVRGAGAGDNEQPGIIIALRGFTSRDRESSSAFALQVFVTQRLLDS